MERPPARVPCVPGRQLSRSVATGEPARFQLSLPPDHPEPYPRVDLGKSRTTSAADSGFLLSERTPCSKSMWVANIEVRKGRPTAACLNRRVVPASFNLQRRRSLMQVHWQLMGYRSMDIVELSESLISLNQFLFQDEFQLIRKLRRAMLYHLLDEYPPRNLTDSLPSLETTLDMLKTGSVRFSSVGVRKLKRELLERFEAMRALFLENRSDVPEAWIRCCATHHGQRKVHAGELFKVVDCCYVPSELVPRSAVIQKLVVSRCAPGTHSTLHEFAALTGSRGIDDRFEQLGTFQMQDLERNDVNLRDLRSMLRFSTNVKTPKVTCTAAFSGLQLSSARVISHNSRLTKIYTSGYMVHVHNLRGRAIEKNVTLKKLSLSQAFLSGDYGLRLEDAISVN